MEAVRRVCMFEHVLTFKNTGVKYMQTQYYRLVLLESLTQWW